jgi:protoporphyrinogen IX oxidase
MQSGAAMAEIYLWLKVVHIVAVISWMAGLFYLPRLYVYHAEQGIGSPISATFKVMERRLLKAIMRPAGAVALLSGGWLVYEGGYHDPVPLWLWLKLGAVLGMTAFHGLLERHAVRFRDDRENAQGRYFRIINEIPTVLLIAIVVFVVLKP